MTFEEITQDWHSLPRSAGKLIRTSVGMQDFIWNLFAPNQRGWFKAC